MLYVVWDSSLPKVSSIGMNPSIADEIRSDPTITREINFAKSWGAGSFMKTNLFGLVSPYPEELGKVKDPIGEMNTPEFIRDCCAGSLYTVAAWGDYEKYAGKKYHYRWLDVAQTVSNLTCLKRSVRGQKMPYHPLYLPGNLTPIPFEI